MNSTTSIQTNYEITLSQEALAGVEAVAKKFNVSVSELFERLGCGQLAIIDPEEVGDIEDYLNLHESLENLQESLEATEHPEYPEYLPWWQVQQELRW